MAVGTRDSEKLLTWLPFIIMSGFIAPNNLPSCYLFNSSEVARGSLAIFSKPTDSRLQYDEQRLWNAGQVTHKLGASLRGWMEKTCVYPNRRKTLRNPLSDWFIIGLWRREPIRPDQRLFRLPRTHQRISCGYSWANAHTVHTQMLRAKKRHYGLGCPWNWTGTHKVTQTAQMTT